jgi:hypothetical protein
MGEGKNTMDRGVKISCTGALYTIAVVKIPWVAGSIYHV